jgi:hypothetical protein
MALDCQTCDLGFPLITVYNIVVNTRTNLTTCIALCCARNGRKRMFVLMLLSDASVVIREYSMTLTPLLLLSP